jgi:hypothetical protein
MIDSNKIKLFLVEEDDRYQDFEKEDQNFIAILLAMSIEDLIKRQNDHNKIIRLYEQAHAHIKDED